MKKALIILGIILILGGGLFAAVQFSQKPETDSNKLSIVTTLFPLYDFAKNIGQDKVAVSLLLPPGVEPHGFEPKPSDIIAIGEADAFIYTGKFMEPWAEDIINGVSADKVKVIDASTGITLIPSVFHHEHEEEEHTEGDEHEEEGSLDPHIWLDFENDQKMIMTIAKALGEKDPENSAYYLTQAEVYIQKLEALDAQYKTALSSCQSNTVIYGGHYAFGYLANRYNLKYMAAQGVSPDAEPTAQDLINLVDQINTDKIKYVFYEELSSTKIADTLANETGASLLLLNAAPNLSRDALDKNTSFIEIMTQNLNNLKTGLQCN